MIVYIDVVFAINFLMDMTIIWAAGMLNKEKIKILKLAFGAALGAVLYIISLYFQYYNTILQIPAALFAMCLSIIVAYAPKTIFHVIKLALISVAVSFAAAGMIFALLCFKTMIAREGIQYVLENFNFGVLVLSSVIIYTVIKIGGKYIRKEISDKREYFDLTVTIGDKKFMAKALADTGNSLKDCMGDNEIIVCEYECMKNVLPNIEMPSDSVLMFKELSATDLCTKIRLIPFKSLGENNGLLLGIKSDRVEISGNKNAVCTNAIICLFNGKLDSRGLFNAITNYDVFL